jgi:CRP/FNR family transcriptional regulator, cyclic AMP receptor protein
VSEIDMRPFAKNAGAKVDFSVGDPGTCLYVVQSGTVEMTIADKVVEISEVIGFMSMLDGAASSLTTRVKEAVELSIIDQSKFHSRSTRCLTARSTSWE